MDFYLVGGAVRDELLGLPVEDRDWVVVGATPKQMLEQGFRQVGADFPVFLHPQTKEEYALARTERKQGRGYHGFTVYSAPDVTLEQDLLRRDLTINAMAMDAQQQLIDPFDGAEDIRQRTLRHVSEAFCEDPLRILRTARFAARFQPLGFAVCPETMALMHSMVDAGEVGHLVPERVWQEIRRALLEQEPGTFFEVLRECGALKVLMPELEPDTIFDSAIAALRFSHHQGGVLEQRFAALLSPLGPDSCRALADRLKATNDCKAMAILASQLRLELLRFCQSVIHPEHLLGLLDTADYWRRPERFRQLCDVLLCTLPAAAHTLIRRLVSAAEQSDSVNARDLLAKGIEGRALGAAIRRERLARITEVLATDTSEERS